MNRRGRRTPDTSIPAPIVGCTARFGEKYRKKATPPEEKPTGRTPRVAHLLALAHRIDMMIRDGELKDWAEAARLIGITRARMTQVAKLMLLNPVIQQEILMCTTAGVARVSPIERSVQNLPTEICWRQQLFHWRRTHPRT